MSEDTMPADQTPADTTTTTMPAGHAPAQETFYEEPAETPEHGDYDEDHLTDDAGLGEILEGRPKKLSGAQRAKLKQEHLQSEIRQERELRQERERRIAELEGHLYEEDSRRRSAESERHAEEQRQRDEAHIQRLKEARGTVTDFDRVMAKMNGVQVRDELIEEIKSSDKSALLAYHLASHPDKLAELNRMNARDRVREVGRLEATLKLPEGRKQTKAPPPPANLKGGAAPHTSLENVEDMGTFSKRLLEDLAARNRR